MWDWFQPITDTVSSVGGWMETNPGGASFVGGVAASSIDYMNAEKQREFDMRRDREERDYRDSRSQASTGNYNYGSHNASLTKGFLAG